MPAQKHTPPGDAPPVPSPEQLEEKYKGKSVELLAKAMYELEVDIEHKSLVIAPLQAEYEYIRLRALPEAAENSGTQTVTIQFTPDYRGRVGLTGDLYVQIIDSDGAYQWLADHGHADLIKNTVHAGSLKSALKQRIEKGAGTPPADFFKLTPFKRASITKA